MCTSDVAAMDCRLKHWGGAYAWTAGGGARVLINATFAVGEGTQRGFTYHRAEEGGGAGSGGSGGVEGLPTLAQLLQPAAAV